MCFRPPARRASAMFVQEMHLKWVARIFLSPSVWIVIVASTMINRDLLSRPFAVGIGSWVPVVIIVAICVFWVAKIWLFFEERKLEVCRASVRCVKCGYDLRGSIGMDRCPECGEKQHFRPR
jgi:hypothetical protein